MHTTTAADPAGETSVLLILGYVTQVLGGGGIGLAVRIEHQATDRTALGVELTGGRGDADSTKLSMLALRGYGRGTPRAHDWVAITYGAGLSILNTGMLTLTAHGGAAVSYPNRYFEPYLATGLALAVPITQGESFGDMDREVAAIGGELGEAGTAHPMSASEAPGVRPNLYLTVDPGFVVPLGDTGHALSLDLGVATGLARKGGFVTFSIADERR